MTVRWRWSALQWGILILAAPVLLFPSLSPEATLLMLLLLSGSWVAASIRRCPWPVTPFNGALLLFATMVGVGIVASAYPELTLPKATGLILGMGLFRAVAGIPGRDGCTLALAGFLLIATGVWGIGLLGTAWSLKVPALQAWLDHLPAEILTVPEAPEQGINPNQLGGALAFLLPVPVALAMRGRVTWRSLPVRLLGGVLAVVWGGEH